MATEFRRIGRGAYTLREAYRLTHVPVRRIRRWTGGYEFELARGRRGRSPAIFQYELDVVDGTPVLTFSDLIEIQFINAFRESGLTWRVIRTAAERAAEIFSSPYPFSNRNFITDGHTILADVVDELGDRRLIDLVRDQYEFRRLVRPYLRKRLEFNLRDEPERWWPLGRRRRILVDPERAFGAPIVDAFGIPTLVLAQSALAEESVRVAARLYDVSEAAVRAAIEFENSLAA